MKPPLTVEAKVAEELRNWLASELEQLDAPNTNQFAHHVVTILLHEDLDIEDEPLTAGDDFLRDIYSIRKCKTRDKQKKAAVQFLRSAVCCDDPSEAEIQIMVDELMVKIDETKMSTKKTSKRGLLAPIAINVETQTNQGCLKSDGSEEERRYNEAFPSLPGDESPSKEGARPTTSSASVWNRSPPVGKENHKRRKKKTLNQTFKHSYLFTCEEEAQACSIARQVAAMALAESTVPNAEAAEVSPSASHDSSSSSFSDSSSCWASAFRTVILTRIFSPSSSPLRSVNPCPADVTAIPKQFSATVIQGITCTFSHAKLGSDLCPETFLTGLPKRLFSPIHGYPITRQKEKNQYDSQEFEDYMDAEVCTIFSAAKNKKKEVQTKVSKVAKKANTSKQVKNDIDIVSFPNHYGTFWQELIHSGVMSLYPDFSNKVVEEGAVKDLATIASKALQSLERKINAKEVIRHFCSSFTVQGGMKTFKGYILGALTDMFMARKEKMSHTKNCRNEDIQSIDRFLDACLEMINDFEAACQNKGPEERNLTGIDTFESHVHEKQWTDTREIANSRGDISFIERSSVEDENCLESDPGLSSTCGYSPSFMDRIDLRYLDEEDKREVKHGQEARHQTVYIDQSSFADKEKRMVESLCKSEWPKTFKDMPSSIEFDSFLPYSHEASLKIFREQIGSTYQDATKGFNSWETNQCKYFELFPAKDEQAQTDWDMVTKELLEIVMARRNPFHQHASSTNPYMPSMLASCLTNKESQFLQSAFVNSYFSTSCQEHTAQTVSTVLALDCSELEQMLYSREMHRPWGMNQAQCELIRGRTCSNWLENNCRLGLLCPFSHPSI